MPPDTPPNLMVRFEQVFRLRALFVHPHRWLIAACAVLSTLPLFVTPIVPSLDGGNNVAVASILAHFNDAQYGFSANYTLNLVPGPYVLYYGPMAFLTTVLPATTAHRIYLGGLQLLLVWSLLAYLSAYRRPRILAILGFPLFWTYCTAVGFYACICSICFALFGLASLAGLHAGFTVRRLATAATFGLAAALAHHFGFVAFVAGALLTCLRFGAIATLPGASLLAISFLFAKQSGAKIAQEFRFEGYFMPFLQRLKALWAEYMFCVLDERWNATLTAGFALILILCFALARRAKQPNRRPAIIFFSALAVYFICPVHITQPIFWSLITPRFGLLLGLLAIGCIPSTRFSGWRLKVVGAACVALVGMNAIGVTAAYRSFGEEADVALSLVDQLPYNPSVHVQIDDQFADGISMHAWAKFAGYVQALRGGWNPRAWRNGWPYRWKANRRDRPREFTLRRCRDACRAIGPNMTCRGRWCLQKH